jgi:hypothetical protein
MLTVEFTVAGIPCIGLNGGPQFKHNEAFSIPDRDRRSGGNRSLVARDCRKRRPGKRVRVV